MEREVLSTTTANAKVNMPYPNIELGVIDDSVTLVLSGLEKGDLPIVGRYEGNTYKVASIRKSAILINRLLRVVPLTYNKNETTKIVLRTADDIMEVLSS